MKRTIRMTGRAPFLRWLWLPALAAILAGCKTNEPEPVPQGPASPHTYPSGPGPAPSGYQQQPAPAPPPAQPAPSFGSVGGFGFRGDPPNITARAAILVDGRGRVIYEKNSSARMPVASTQKLLLAILVAENGNLSKPVTVAESDTWAEPTKMGIRTGQVYTRQELLRAVLIRSSNDIANCLARDHSGSVGAFVANMNRKARQLGMYNSYFTNAHGLPEPAGQFSTARDLAVLAQAAMRKSVIRDTVRSKGMVFRFSDGRTKSLTNTNQVLKNFPNCIGMKTGYTRAAGRCLVSAGASGSKMCYAVILGSQSPTVWQESEALLRYGLGM